MSQEAKTSCDGCAHYLGGGLCAINVEGECREGGGYELYNLQEKPSGLQPSESRAYDDEHRIFLLLQMERKAHAETRRRLEKADHDRKRYARRIRFMDSRHAILCAEYHAVLKERNILKSALAACERSLQNAEN